MIRVHSLGPFYKDWGLWWGVERDIPVYDTKTVCYSWMIEDHTPWRYSKWGCRFRLGSNALHMGICGQGTDPYRRDIAPIEEINQWRRPGAQVTEVGGSPDPGGEPLRPAEFGEPVAGPEGEPVDVDAPDGRVPSLQGAGSGTELDPDRA